jgi:hypothetical protein
MKLTTQAEVSGVMVDITVDIDPTVAAMEQGLPRTLSDDALNRIQSTIRRETQRAAEIAFVDLRDQKAAREEAIRLRALPADRPQIVVGAGTKADTAVQVIRGEWEVNKKKLSAPKPGGSDAR